MFREFSRLRYEGVYVRTANCNIRPYNIPCKAQFVGLIEDRRVIRAATEHGLKCCFTFLKTKDRHHHVLCPGQCRGSATFGCTIKMLNKAMERVTMFVGFEKPEQT